MIECEMISFLLFDLNMLLLQWKYYVHTLHIQPLKDEQSIEIILPRDHFVIIVKTVWFPKVRSPYDPFAYFSNSFISGESMVITIELDLIFKAYYEEQSFNLEKYESILRKT